MSIATKNTASHHHLEVNVPNHWRVVPLENILSGIVGGGTPSRSKASYWEGSIPWLTVKDMRTTRPADAIDHISEKAVMESATNIIPPDTIIIATRVGLGKIIRVPFEAAINQDLKALITKPEVDKSYLEYWFMCIADYLGSIGSGTTVKGIRLEQLRSLPVPLAPLDDQKRIVAEIEKQFSRLDEAVNSLKRAKANLKRYKAAVLKAAVEGKLTEEWRKQHPDVEPASELQKRILTERRRKWEEVELAKMSAKDKEPKNDKWKEKHKKQEGFGRKMLQTMPTGWIRSTIGQLFDVYIGSTPSRKKPAYWDGDIPWVSSGEVSFCNIRSTREKITIEGLNNSSTIIHPKGTVLLGMIGEGKTRGQAAVLHINACNNQNSAAIRVSETDILPEYLYYLLEFDYVRTRKLGSGGNQPALNKRRVQNIIVPLPPVEEQKILVSRIVSIASIYEKLITLEEANLLRAESLRQSILLKAFSGKLSVTNKSENIK